MEKYLTTFLNEAAYNTFLNSEDCPYVNVSYITSTDENKYYKQTSVNQLKPLTITISGLPSNTYIHHFVMRVYSDGETWGNKWFKVKVNNNDWVQVWSKSDTNWDYEDFTITKANDDPNYTTTYFENGDTIQFLGSNIQHIEFFNVEQTGDSVYDSNVRFTPSGNLYSPLTEDYAYGFPKGKAPNGPRVHGFITSKTPWGGSIYVSDASNLYLPTKGLEPYCFNGLFNGNSILTVAPAINATVIPPLACQDMFKECTALTTMPVIAAKALFTGSLATMFQGCTSLVNTTPLHVEKLYNGRAHFSGMFAGCTSLVTAPTWDVNWVCEPYTGSRYTTDQNDWTEIFISTFGGCTSLTTCNWKMTKEAAFYNNYTFNTDSALTTAPSISLGDVMNDTFDYGGMFNGCSSLTEIVAPKLKGEINMGEFGDHAQSGIIYVHDESRYLNPEDGLYGQTPIEGWTVKGISEYPNA